MRKKLILIVEDDEPIRTQMAEVFQFEGYPVLTAENGRQALTLLHTLGELPGLILLDLNMPVLDGQGFLTEIQKSSANQRLSQIPVAIFSASRHEVVGNVVAKFRKPPELEEVLAVASKFAQG